MFDGYGRRIARAVLAAAVALTGTAAARAQGAGPAPAPGVAATPAGVAPHAVWVRILPFALKNRGWQLDDYNGEQILDMIRELRPDVLERFITGEPDPSVEVPMGPGVAPMRFVPYLDAAMRAEAPGGFLTPKVHLNDIWSDDYRMASARALVDLPVEPRLTLLSLDQYFSSGTPEDHRRTLESFLAMGWKGLGFNFAGGPKPVYGLATYAMAGVSPMTWDVNRRALAAMGTEGIPIHLVHIDYPEPIGRFAALAPDRQADIIQKIVGEQRRDGFSFVYPVLYGSGRYDASKEITRPDGPYKGASIFKIIRDDIRCDRLYPAPCVHHFGS